MIHSLGVEEEVRSGARKDSASMVQEALSNNKYRRLSDEQLKIFLNEHQIIHCAHYLEQGVSYKKLLKIYFILFQVCMKYSNKESIYNFLCQHNFSQMLQAHQNNQSKLYSIISDKIAKFLDSFKVKRCPKVQINSLINEYHQFRLLENNKQPYVIQSCILIKDYIFYHLNSLISELQQTNWIQMNPSQFQSFYQHYSQICTICKRASYIKCHFFAFPAFEIPVSNRNKIQERFGSLLEIQSGEMPCLAQRQKKEIPVISVKKKLKAMNSLILKMQQKI